MMTAPVFLVLALAGPADPTSGVQLQRMCNADPPSPVYAACILYVTGYADGVAAATDLRLQQGVALACLPKDVTGEELRQVTLRALRGNESRQKAPMNAVMAGALAEAYPCPKRAKR
jgi:hypothetical protein